MTLLDKFTNTDNAAIAAKAASISQRIQEKLALDKHLRTIEQAIVLRYIAETKLMQGAFPLPHRARVAQQLAKLDASLRALGEILDEVRDEAKANRAHEGREPMTLEESLELLQEAEAETAETAETAEDA